MADQSIAITPGSGSQVDTRTEGTNGNHRQVIVIGDPATNAGVAPVDATYGLAVDVTRVAAGAATSALQTTGNTSLASIDGKITAVNTGAVVVSSSALPSGAATSALQTSGNASLTTLAGAVSGTEVQVDVLTMPTVTVTGALTDAQLRATAVPVSGTFYQATQPVSAASLPLPTGASTSANQTTIIGHLDGVEGLLTTIDADTGTVASTVATIGTTPLARVAIFDSANTQITSFGGGTEYTEDAAAAGNPVGKALIGVRADTLAGVTSADGDNVAARMTDKGELYVKHADALTVASHAVTNAGTFAVQAAQSGTWTVQPGNTANTTAWKVDGSAVTQPVSAASLPLPALAATSTKQSDGSQKTQIVDGGGAVIASTSNALNVHIASGASSGTQYTEGDIDATITGTTMMWEDASDTLRAVSAAKPLPVDLQDASVAVTGTFWQATQPVSGTVAVTGVSTVAEQQTQTTHLATIAGDTTSIQTSVELIDDAIYTDGTGTPSKAIGVAGTDGTNPQIIKTDAAGELQVDVLTMPTVAVTGTFWQATQPVSLASVPSHAVTNAGTFATQVTGDALTALQLIDDAVQTEDLAHTTGHKGVMILGVRKDTATALAGTDGDYIPAIFDANGAQHVNLATKLDSTNDSIAVHAVTTGGATPYKLNSAATTNATNVKGSAGQIYTILCTNTNAAVRYLKIYNKATAPTVGTDTPVQTYAIPGATTGGGFSISFPVGLKLSTGISFALTTEATDAGTTAVAANEILVNLTYA